MRILVVDDDLAVLRSMKKLLTHEGHDVVTAQDGDEALKAIYTSLVKFEIVLLDLEMPGRFDGYDLLRLRRMSKTLQDVPVIIISGASEEDLRAHGNIEGVALWFSKPVDFDRLQIVLEHFSRTTSRPPPPPPPEDEG